MAMPRKTLNTRSKDFGIRLGLHLRKLLGKRKLSAAQFRDTCQREGLDVSIVTVHKWLRGERLPLARDFEEIGKALGMKDYRQALPPPPE